MSEREREKATVHATVAWFHASGCAREGWIIGRICLFPSWVYIELSISLKQQLNMLFQSKKMCFYTFPLTLTQSLLLAHWSIFSSGPNCLKRMFWLMKFYIPFCSQINAHYNSLHIFLNFILLFIARWKGTKLYIPAAELIELFKKQFLSNFIWIDWLTTAETVQGRGRCWALGDDGSEAQTPIGFMQLWFASWIFLGYLDPPAWDPESLLLYQACGPAWTAGSLVVHCVFCLWLK